MDRERWDGMTMDGMKWAGIAGRDSGLRREGERRAGKELQVNHVRPHLPLPLSTHLILSLISRPKYSIRGPF